MGSLEHDRELTRYGFQSYNDAVSSHVPGKGAGSQDVLPTSDFQAHMIPEYPTPHLLHHYNRLHNALYTLEGVRNLDVEKREWINMSLARRAIQHELTLRGLNGSIPKPPSHLDLPMNTHSGRPSRKTKDGGVLPAIYEPDQTYGFETDHGRPTGGADFH
jgi:hypothetical protein